MRGNCYATCEALFHLLGGKRAGYVQCVMRVKGGSHWFLLHRTGLIIDPTASQFDHPNSKTKRRELDYTKATGCGFLTKKPSKRAREMMQYMVWQKEGER